MSGRKSFETLSAKLTPEQRRAVDASKADLRGRMMLAELRQARRLTQ